MSGNVTELQRLEIEEVEEIYKELGFGPAGETHERFKINDLEQLNWVFRKLDAYTSKADGVKKLAESELKRIEEWKAKELSGIKANIEFFEHLVREYAERQRSEDPKYKGEKTPYGTLGFTKQQPEWNYVDEEATIAFLKADEKLFSHVRTVDEIVHKTEVKKVLEIKRNAFVRGNEVVDIAENTPGGWIGMQYMQRVTEIAEDAEIDPAAELPTGLVVVEIVDMSTGEVAEDVKLVGAVATYNGIIVPGLNIVDKPDKINVKTV